MKYKRHPQIEQIQKEMVTEYSKCCNYLYVEINDYGKIPIQTEQITFYNTMIGKPDTEYVAPTNIAYYRYEGDPDPIPMLTPRNFTVYQRNQNDPSETRCIIDGVCISYLPPLQDYAKGFIEGYNQEFKPSFIDTIEARKELVMNTALKECKCFSYVHSFIDPDKRHLLKVTMSLNDFENKYHSLCKEKFNNRHVLTDLYHDGFYEGERYKAWEIIFETPNVFIDYFKKETPKEQTLSKPLHFTRSFTDAEQKSLFDGLVSVGFIPKDTNINHFCFVFGGAETADFEPLQWMGTIALLAYFIDNCFSDTDGTTLWKITEGCFTVKGNKPNTDSLKNTVSKYKQDIKDKPKGYERIDDILRLL